MRCTIIRELRSERKIMYKHKSNLKYIIFVYIIVTYNRIIYI
jgi:hypothetical protein